MEKPHSKFRHVYAIVRIDFPIDPSSPENCFSVTKVLSTKVIAEREVARLREVNRDKRCVYELCTTRMVT